MRLWSLHPSLLDRQGLTALWREGLLAQAVLAGRTKGYRHHPQLQRFQATSEPLAALVAYLDAVQQEATARGYRYDPARLDEVPRWQGTIEVAAGQVALELEHLRAKVAHRSPDRLDGLPPVGAAPGRSHCTRRSGSSRDRWPTGSALGRPDELASDDRAGRTAVPRRAR